MTKISTATQFFLPMFDGDQSAFDSYRLGESTPDMKDMDAFIEVVFDGAEQYLGGYPATEVIGKRGALHKARTAYASDLVFAEALRKWCFEQATLAATHNA